MNEMLLNKKIEKREKFDTILAYILIVILLGCILFVLYLKFIRKEESVSAPEEYVPNYITLNEISDELNISTLASRYTNEGINFSSSVFNNSIVVNYLDGETDIRMDIPLVGSELAVDIPSDIVDIATDIYKEIGSIICVYYGNKEMNCRNTLDNITEESNIDGIRIDNNDDNNIVYINITKSYAVNDYMMYNDVTKVNIGDTDYILNLDDIKIYDVSAVSSDTSIKFVGSIERLSDDTSNVSVVVKLFDIDGNMIGENKYDYDDENVLKNDSVFEVEILFDETLKLNDIDKYSIEIIK